MGRTRSSVLLGTIFFLVFGLLPVCAAQQTLPDPTPWLASGPMPGFSELTDTAIWLQTSRPVRAEIRFWKQGEPASTRLSDPIQTTREGDLVAEFRLSGLQFGTKYEYEVYLDGLRVPTKEPLAFHTQHMWRWRTDPPAFRAMFASCAYINDPPFDRPGTPYGGGYEIFDTMAAQGADLMLWLGDNIYYREADWLTEAGMRYRYRHNRALPELQKLLRSTQHYAIWDDHDFGPNDSDRTFRGRDDSLRVFQDYWANPAYGQREAPGVYFRFEWEDVEFFMLDGRYYRSPEYFPAGPDKVMLGAAQYDWLINTLKSSNAPFKIIVGGSQMLQQKSKYEHFADFAEYRKLLDFIKSAKVRGVVFLSGDRHISLLTKLQEPGQYPLYDFTSSPMTAGLGTVLDEDKPTLVPGTMVSDTKSFGLLEFSGPRTDRKLLMRAIDPGGRELWHYEIKARDLDFPREEPKAK